MDAQPNHGGRRRRRRKKSNTAKAGPVEPVFIVARRPDSPRLEKPTRRMKAASARPRGTALTAKEALEAQSQLKAAELKSEAEPAELRKDRRQARIVVRQTGAPDEAEKNRLRLLSRLMAAEGRAAISRAIDAYLAEGFVLPREQEVQLKLLEHFDETKAGQAISHLVELIAVEPPRQLPVLRQRLRRIEDHADEESMRHAAAQLRRQLPAG